MLGPSADQFREQIDKWKQTARQFGKGIEEDTMEDPIEYPVRVAMHKYTRRGLFVIPGEGEEYIFANPATTIGVRILKAKAHINRLIRCVEEVNVATRGEIVWDFLELALAQFTAQHPGQEHDITMEAMSAREIESYATRIRQTQELQVAVGISLTHGANAPDYYLMFRTPVHTVCPFALHETSDEGHCGPSHTQRAYLQVEMWSTRPPKFTSVLREIDNRMQPCQSGMKIPDEVVQVLRTYSAPTYTEDAVLRLLKIIRGTKDEIVPEGHVLRVRVHVQSQESIFQNDMTSEASDIIE